MVKFQHQKFLAESFVIISPLNFIEQTFTVESLILPQMPTLVCFPVLGFYGHSKMRKKKIFDFRKQLWYNEVKYLKKIQKSNFLKQIYSGIVDTCVQMNFMGVLLNGLSI